MEQFENILIWLIILLAAIYLLRKFLRQWKSLTDPKAPLSCGDGCGSCKEASCNDKEFTSREL